MLAGKKAKGEIEEKNVFLVVKFVLHKKNNVLYIKWIRKLLSKSYKSLYNSNNPGIAKRYVLKCIIQRERRANTFSRYVLKDI